jgi:hypothetical protein
MLAVCLHFWAIDMHIIFVRYKVVEEEVFEYIAYLWI